MAVTNFFKEAIESGDIRSIRIMMSDSLLVDPTFKEFGEMNKLAGDIPSLYDKHDGQELYKDKSSWDDNYMNKLMVKVLRNFSHERVDHLKEVVRYLRPVDETKSKKSNTINSSNIIKSFTIFLKSIEKQIFELDNDLKDINKSLTKAESAYNKENTDECKTSIDNLKNQKEYITKKLNILNSGLGKYHEVITELSNNK